MDNLMKMDVTAVSLAGKQSVENPENFYLNGRSINGYELENIQVSMESNTSDHLYAVTHGMDRTVNEKRASVSMAKELKKLQDSVKGRELDLDNQLAQFKERIEEMNNIIYSMSINGIGEAGGGLETDPAIAGLLISGERAVALNMGRCRVYHVRDESLRLMTGNARRSDRFPKAGGLTSEQLAAISSRLGMQVDDLQTVIQKSEVIQVRAGDVFLLCSDGATEMLENEKLEEILLSNKDSAYMANQIVREAVCAGAVGEMTAVVIRIPQDRKPEKAAFKVEPQAEKRAYRQARSDGGENLKTVAAAAAVILIAAAVLLAAYFKIWSGSKKDTGLQPVDSKSAMAEPTNDKMNLDPSASQQPAKDADKGNGSGDKDTGDKNQDGAVSINPADKPDASAEEPAKPAAGDKSASGKRTYTVQKNDSLQKISKKYYNDITQYKKIMEANNITNPNQIKAGQVLVIPD